MPLPRPYFGGRNSPLLIHPEALSDASGSLGSHFSQRRARRPLAPGGGGGSKMPPHLGQVSRSACPTPCIWRQFRRAVHFKWKSARRIVFPVAGLQRRTVLIQRFRDQANSEHRPPGIVLKLHLPFGILFELAGNPANHIAADAGQLFPGGVAVGNLGAMVRRARILATLDAEEIDRHGIETDA